MTGEKRKIGRRRRGEDDSRNVEGRDGGEEERMTGEMWKVGMGEKRRG